MRLLPTLGLYSSWLQFLHHGKITQNQQQQQMSVFVCVFYVLLLSAIGRQVD